MDFSKFCCWFGIKGVGSSCSQLCVHTAVAGDKDSAGCEAHPPFHWRWWPRFRMPCGFEVPHLQGGASVAWGEAVLVLERVTLASRCSSLSCYSNACAFRVTQWIRKGLLQCYNVCVFCPCGCVGFYCCKSVRNGWCHLVVCVLLSDSLPALWPG